MSPSANQNVDNKLWPCPNHKVNPKISPSANHKVEPNWYYALTVKFILKKDHAQTIKLRFWLTYLFRLVIYFRMLLFSSVYKTRSFRAQFLQIFSVKFDFVKVPQ